MDYSQWDFGLHNKRIIEGLKNRIANKAFRYVLIPLQDGVVKIYLQTHIVETRSRWCRTWRGNGYKDGSKPWKSCPNHVWKSCLRFWKLAKGMEGLARSSYARSCAQFVSTSGIVPNMSRMHELVIFCVHFFGRVICNQFWILIWWTCLIRDAGRGYPQKQRGGFLVTRNHPKTSYLLQNFLTSTQQRANLGIIDGKSMLWVFSLNFMYVLHSWIRMFVIWSISHHEIECESRWYDGMWHAWIACHKGCFPSGDKNLLTRIRRSGIRLLK